jgi:alkylation response protein AidB-like acyl-CoA dehydrogenase
MDFTPSPAQIALSALTRQILQDRSGQLNRFDPKLWDTLASTGVLGATLPEAVGGDGHDLLEQCSVLVELGRELAPVPYLATVATGGAVLARYGTPAQQADWLKPVLDGRMILAVALVEPDGGDPATPSTRAVPTPTGWTLTGTKTTVLAGPAAHLILVSAHTPDGPALFAVAPDDPGVRISRQRMIDHDDAAQVELAEVSLPADRRIGWADVGPVAWVLRRATVALCAHQLGVLERALELTAEYASTRTQFDRPIGSFQAVAQRLADAYIQVQALRLAMWNAAWTLDATSSDETASAQPGTAVMAVATAKFWAAEAGHYVAHTCVHVHGGAGIDVEHPIHRYFLAAKRAEFDLGSATAHLLTLGAALAHP